MELANWGDLESLPLSLIFDKLVEPIDHICFSVVCKNWYSIAKFNYQYPQIKNNVFPMLLIPTTTRSESKMKILLYGISSKTVNPLQLPLPSNKRLCGSSHGWIAMVSEVKFITLLNPFKNRVSISLPPIDMPRNINRQVRFNECEVHKVILSSDPTIRPYDYVVVAIYGTRKTLAFIKAGQKFWTFIDQRYYSFSDVMFYKGLVYAVEHCSNIVSFNVCNLEDSVNREKVIPNVVSSSGCGFAHRTYFVKSLEGDLWLVKKYTITTNHTADFFVYKLEFDLQSGNLIQMIMLDSLGDNVLFVGNGNSVSRFASYFANYLQKDSIYCANDDWQNNAYPYFTSLFDMEIYNVKDRSYRQHYASGHCITPPSLWVLPSFQ